MSKKDPSARRLFSMRLERVPFSSIVGQSMTIVSAEHGVVAHIVIMVPQVRMDYRTVSDAVASALLDGHVSRDGVTLVLPSNFADGAA